MAAELGLGVTPWSPLKSGALSGKYTRDKHGQQEAGRGERVTAVLDERAYDIIETVGDIARELDCPPARVALAWVQGRPGVTSTIIGARTLAQLDENLAALDLALGEDQLARLEAASEPRLNFPADFLKFAPAFAYGGTTIEGQSAEWPPFMPTDEERY